MDTVNTTPRRSYEWIADLQRDTATAAFALKDDRLQAWIRETKSEIKSSDDGYNFSAAEWEDMTEHPGSISPDLLNRYRREGYVRLATQLVTLVACQTIAAQRYIRGKRKEMQIKFDAASNALNAAELDKHLAENIGKSRADIRNMFCEAGVSHSHPGLWSKINDCLQANPAPLKEADLVFLLVNAKTTSDTVKVRLAGALVRLGFYCEQLAPSAPQEAVVISMADKPTRERLPHLVGGVDAYHDADMA